MKRYMVLLGSPLTPEYVDADNFAVEPGHVLQFSACDRESGASHISAAFVNWIGVKEVEQRTGSSNPSRAKLADVRITTADPTTSVTISES